MRRQASVKGRVWESSLCMTTCSGNCTELSVRSLSAVPLLFGFILWEVALHSDSDYKGFCESWISALAVLILPCVSHSPWWGLSSPYFVQPLSNADKIPPSYKDSRRKQRQRVRASGDKHCSLPWTPCFETLAKLTEVIVVIWLNNKIHIQPISQKCSQQCSILLFLFP